MAENKENKTHVPAEIQEQIRVMAKQLKDGRIKAGLSQVELAKKISVSQPAIVWIEAGNNTQLATVLRYANYLGLKLNLSDK